MNWHRWRESSTRSPRIGVRDLMSEALAGVLQRPRRAFLASVGTLLGVAAFVAVPGITATAATQLSRRSATLAATQVVVEDAGKRDATGATDPFPSDAETRLAQLDGVLGGGVYRPVPQQGDGVRVAAAGLDAPGEQIRVLAASPGLFDAVNPRLAAGRTFDGFHDRVGAPVAVVGAGIAQRLGIGALDTHPAVFINHVPHTVIGVLERSERLPDLMLAVTIPIGSADAIAPPPTGGEPPKMLVATRLGAARQVAQELPLALRPDAPEALRAVPPHDARSLGEPVPGELGGLLVLLVGGLLVIGTVTIGSAMFVAVLERVPEIGLRRAYGASRGHVATQFLAESALLGALGGVFGCALGAVTVVAFAVWRGWPPVAQPWVVLLAPVIGTLAGMAAGVYPALRAGRVEPVGALRR